MELIYLLIFLISFFIEDIENVLLKKTSINTFTDKKILFILRETSLLQCVQRCRFIDKNAQVHFENSKCTCIKCGLDEGQEQHRTLTGVFVNQKMMTKPALTRVINVALNKLAKQSSTDGGLNYVAIKAIDGYDSTASDTNYELKPWWSVDLKTNTDIMYMVLDGYYNSAHNRALIVETKPGNGIKWIICKDIGNLQTRPFTFKCDSPTNAQYVRIRSSEACRINIAEFEVYARVAA